MTHGRGGELHSVPVSLNRAIELRHRVRGAALTLLLTACTSASPGTNPTHADTSTPQCDTCEEDGRCTVTPYGCQAGSAADCRQSRLCIDQGWCDVDDGQCVAQKVIP